MRHYTIPVFVPELACPNRCVFCNQQRISGTLCQPSEPEVVESIEKHLATMPCGSDIEIGFFGGNFTGIEEALQEHYLQIAQRYIDQGRVKAIRLSTRPDYIDVASLKLLKKYTVGTIELGAQSLDEEVLKLSGRGHTVREVQHASAMILKHGFSLGLQMMIGLPGDTAEKSIQTAREIIRLGADNTRIYPTLVIKNTELEKRFQSGDYSPLSLGEAVSRVADLVPLFVEANVTILRIGLHPSEGLLDRSGLVAGPFHVAFGEMVYSEIWRRRFQSLTTGGYQHETLVLTVPTGTRNAAIGHKALNKEMLLRHFRKVVFTESMELKGFGYHADTR